MIDYYSLEGEKTKYTLYVIFILVILLLHMPVHKLIRKVRKSPGSNNIDNNFYYRNNTAITTTTTTNTTMSSNSSSDGNSSHATISEDSSVVSGNFLLLGKGVDDQRKEKFPVGTVVKKYFNRDGWCSGAITSISDGIYKVEYDLPPTAPAKDYSYTASQLPRLLKTAAVREGTRVEIFWPQEKRYFAATIETERQRKRENYLVVYDGQREREWIDLHRHKFRIVHQPTSIPKKFHPKEVLVPRRTDDNNDCENNPNACIETTNTDHTNASKPVPNEQISHPKLEKIDKPPESTSTVGISTKINKPHRTKDVISPETIPSLREISRDEESITKAIARVSDDVNNIKKSTASSAAAFINSPSESPGGNSSVMSRGVVKNLDCTTPFLEEKVVQQSTAHETHPHPTNLRTVSNEHHIHQNGSSESIQHNQQQNSNNLKPVNLSDEPTASPAAAAVKIRSEQVDEMNDDDKKVDDENKRLPENDEKVAENHKSFVENNKQVDEDDGQRVNENDGSVRDSEEDESIEGVTIDPVSDPATKKVVTSLIAIGSRVSVYWEDDKKFYTGTVTDRKFRGKPFYLEYDDGEEEWIDLRQHKFRLLQTFPSPSSSPRKHSDRDDSSNRNMPRQRRTTAAVSLVEQNKVNNRDSKTLLKDNKNALFGKNVQSEKHPEPPPPPPPPPPFSPSSKKKQLARAGRKAALDALAEKKRLSRSPPSSDDDETDVDDHNSEMSDKPFLGHQKIDEKKVDIVAPKPPVLEIEMETNGHSELNDISEVTVGSRVAVWSDGDNKYYSGNITQERVHKKPFYLVYDDGMAEEWIDLRSHRFRLLPSIAPGKKKRGRPKKNNLSTRIRVGTRVSVWWSTVSKFYDGTVTKQRRDEKPYFVEYDDGDSGHWMDFSKHTYKIIDESMEDDGNYPQEEQQEIDEKKRKKKGDNKQSNKKPKIQEDITLEDTAGSLGITIGTRVSVYWEGDSKYYEGTVTHERPNGKKRHYIEYDDGEAAHWIDFKEHWVRVLPDDPGKKKPAKKPEPEPETKAGPAKKKVKKNKKEPTSDVITTTIFNRPVRKPGEFGSVIEVGSRLKVWWAGDRRYYRGTVKRKDGKNRYYIRYDDDEEEWIDANRHSFRTMSPESDVDTVSSSSSSDDDETDDEDIIVDKPPQKATEKATSTKKQTQRKSANGSLRKSVQHEDSDTDESVNNRNSKKRPSGKLNKKSEAPKKKRSSVRDDDTDDDPREDNPKNKKYSGKKSKKSDVKKKSTKKPVPKVVKRTIHDTDDEDSDDERNTKQRPGKVISKNTKKSTKAKMHETHDESDSESEMDDIAYDDFVYGAVDQVSIGSRLSIWWPYEKKYYDGTVTQIDDSRKPYFVEYDDGDEEWTDLKRRYFRFLD